MSTIHRKSRRRTAGLLPDVLTRFWNGEKPPQTSATAEEAEQITDAIFFGWAERDGPRVEWKQHPHQTAWFRWTDSAKEITP